MSQMIAKENITGLVLAGGRGARMGSLDKGLQLFRGKLLFLHATDRLAPQVATVRVNANRNLKCYAQAGFPVIQDELPDFAGPLAGFAAGLRYCRTAYMVTVPCDSPFFPRSLVDELGMALLRDKADIAIAVTGPEPPYTPQPVFCLMKRELLPHLDAFLATGQHKIDAWYASLHVAQAHFPDMSCFMNINTLKELENLEGQMKNKN